MSHTATDHVTAPHLSHPRLPLKSHKPNVIVFLTDQQRHDTAGFHGGPAGLTPNLDRAAGEGTLVANSFTCQPVCAPARSCLQTGLYATNTGVWCNGHRISANLSTLADYFNDAGYHTGYIGKWHLMPDEFHGGVPRDGQGGYQSWLGANILEFVSDAYDCRLFDEVGAEHRLPGYRVDAVADAAIRHIQTHAANPFFLFLSFIEPHHQNSRDDYPAPDGYEALFAEAPLPPDLIALGGSARKHWAGYCGMVKRLDEAYGRLLDSLKSMGLHDNTIVLFTSDHGNHFKTRNAEYKRSCHDSSIRVPTVVTGPGFENGGRIESLVSLIDLPPTLLDAAHLPVPDIMQGRSFLPLVQNNSAVWQDDIFVQISESQTGRAVRTDRWKYSARNPENYAWGDPVSLPGADLYVDDALYDLQNDPWELNNLIGQPDYANTLLEMRERLIRRMVAAGESAPRIEP